MILIAKKILRDFWQMHADSEEQLKTWYKKASTENWNCPITIKAEYLNTSILKNGHLVYNICGNKYRLIVDITYVRQWMFIRLIGTHNDYNKVEADKI